MKFNKELYILYFVYVSERKKLTVYFFKILLIFFVHRYRAERYWAETGQVRLVLGSSIRLSAHFFKIEWVGSIYSFGNQGAEPHQSEANDVISHLFFLIVSRR